MNERDISFTSEGETLSGRVLQPNQSANERSLLFLHGAGKATKERAWPIAKLLAERCAISSFGFDFSGHGASTGQLENSSLQRRSNEAFAALSASGLKEPVGICAFSMGGHIALELLGRVRTRALILFYPAVYAADAVPLRFGDAAFSATIRRERSWENAEVLANLAEFHGDLLIVSGENDEVIPREVLDSIINSASAARSRELVVVPKAPHLLLPALMEAPALLDEVLSKICSFFDS